MSSSSATPRTGLRAFVRALGFVAGGALALFHLWLFAGRLRDLSIVEPRVAASWLGSAALGLLALYLKRRGLPLASGRSGLVFWLLVLLLHLFMTPGEPVLGSLELTLALGLELAVAACLLAEFVSGSEALPPGFRGQPFLALARRPVLAGGPLAAPRPPPTR